MSGYQRPAAAEGALRLHLNENTAGASPDAVAAIAALDAEDLAYYPEYDAVVAETAAYLGVDTSQLLLTNGLDEGILAAAVATARATVADGAPRPDVIVPLPAFDMYGVCARAVGARLVTVQPRRDFEFALDNVLRAITPATRLVFITSPNNPTGVRIRLSDIERVAASVPSGGLVFVDEAYHDFCGDTALPLLQSRDNVIVGRTFAKGHGLAALRAGAVIGRPETLGALRLVVPPYSLNVCAAVALRAALADRARLTWYRDEVRASRELVYAWCRGRGVPFWESGANFVLIRIGDRAREVVDGLARRGVVVRERSGDAGCEGCVRMTTGVVAHTQRGLDALEEVLCAAE